MGLIRKVRLEKNETELKKTKKLSRAAEIMTIQNESTLHKYKILDDQNCKNWTTVLKTSLRRATDPYNSRFYPFSSTTP